jgi:hypothetical protein
VSVGWDWKDNPNEDSRPTVVEEAVLIDEDRD